MWRSIARVRKHYAHTAGKRTTKKRPARRRRNNKNVLHATEEGRNAPKYEKITKTERHTKCYWKGSRTEPIMDCKKTPKPKEQNKKHKSPSKQARDGRRLWKWLNLHHTKKKIMRDESTQVYLCDLIEHSQPATHILTKFLGNKSTTNSNTTQKLERKPIHDHQNKPIEPPPSSNKQTHCEQSPINPAEIYRKIENNLSLTRLEEPANLSRSIRYAVRNLHKNDKSIIFPYQNAVDKIQLKISGLPTDPAEV